MFNQERNKYDKARKPHEQFGIFLRESNKQNQNYLLSSRLIAAAVGLYYKTRPGDLVGARPNWVTFWSKFGQF